MNKQPIHWTFGLDISTYRDGRWYVGIMLFKSKYFLQCWPDLIGLREPPAVWSLGKINGWVWSKANRKVR